MIEDYFRVSLQEMYMIPLSGAVIYIAILVCTRLTGLRSFSKMSASDFAMTVAVGSVFASAILSPSPTVGVAFVALIVLFLGQWVFAYCRNKSKKFRSLVENKPLLLMRGTMFVEKNLRKANVTESDVIAKLREANVLSLKQVKAVVFETTGDISVLHSNELSKSLDDDILREVVE